MSTVQDTSLIPEKTSNNTGKVVFLGVSFMILFSAFNIAQNLVTQIFSQEGYTNLGQYCIFAIYGCFGCSSFVVSNIKAKLSHKAGLIIGATGYLSFLVAGAVGCYCVQEELHDGLCTDFSIYSFNIITASYLGFCAGLLWLSQSSYVNDCANPSNVGYLTGTFWSLCQTSQILGSLIAAFVLANTNHFVFYMLMCCMATLAIVMFFFLPTVRPQQDTEAKVVPVKESIENFMATFKDEKMQKMFPQMFFNGVIIAFYATIIPKIVQLALVDKSENQVNEQTSFIFTALGATEFFTGSLMGKLVDKFKKVYILNLCNLLIQTAIFVSLISYFQLSYAGCVVAGVAWGLAEISSNTTITALIGKDFDGRLEGFTMFRFFQAVGAIVGIILNISLANTPLYVEIAIVAILQLSVNPILNTYKSKEE